MEYFNYHRHSDASNIKAGIDSCAKLTDYASRCVELGHRFFSTCEHGNFLRIISQYDVAKSNNLVCIPVVEAYMVEDNNPELKDDSNLHIIIVPKTTKARHKLHMALSDAEEFGFYRKPRLSLNQIMAFDKEDLYITTACTGGITNNEKIFLSLIKYFGDNLFLEVQPHIAEEQKDLNRYCLELHQKYGNRLIAANDSHYILEEDSSKRDEFIAGKRDSSNVYDNSGYILDFPTYEVMKERFVRQGVLTDSDIEEAIANTMIFTTVEPVVFDKEIKMPNIYHELSPDERVTKLKSIVQDKYKKLVSQGIFDKVNHAQYKKAILEEMKVIEDTKSVNTMDYFLLNERLVDVAVNKYGGRLTKTGRGSCGSMLINMVLGLTQLDRLSYDLPMFYERFMSTARILENRALPDWDANMAEQEPFVLAARELLGQNGCYPMLALGTMQQAECFRNLCRAKDIDYATANEVSKNIETYKNDPKWKGLIRQAEEMIGTIVSVSPHPCAHLIFNGNIREELGVIRIGDAICANITGSEADDYKYLKNDFLVVTVWSWIYDTFKAIEQPVITVPQLLADVKDDQRIWDLYSNGCTLSLNQCEGNDRYLEVYKPKNIEELSQFVAAIRPGFNSNRDSFLKRIPHKCGNAMMDDVFSQTNGYVVFQENIMRWFEWLGITPAESIGLIKKISKKKIHQEDFDRLSDRLKAEWIRKTGSADGFDKQWEDMQSNLSYSFNSPHGLATAIDSLYSAWLKVHYPLQYYTVLLNSYAESKDTTKTAQAVIEMKKFFGIELEPIKFRKSNEFYSNNGENIIYKGISSIKTLNRDVAEKIISLYGEQFEDFFQLLERMKELGINKTSILALIKVGFFDEFGEREILLEMHSKFDTYWTKKSVKFDGKTPDEIVELAKIHCEKVTEKQASRVNFPAVVRELCQNLQVEVDEYARASWETELTGECSKRKVEGWVVNDVEINRYGTVFATITCIWTGKISQYRADKKTYKERPFQKYDIIKPVFTNRKVYNTEKEKWEETNEKILRTWSPIRNYQK